MKTFKKILILVLLFTINNVLAQMETNHDMLQKKLWKFEKHDEVIDLYTPTKIKTFYYGKQELELDYYLSETDVTEGNFDATKVGNSIIGKYIVTEKGCYEIINITNTNLIIRNIKQEHNIELFVN